MRYDTPIYFQSVQQGEYDPSTGNYGEDTPIEEMRWASVTDSTTETLNLVYGGIKQGSLTLRLQNHYDKPFDCIRIGGKRYSVDKARKLRTKQVFIVSEVQ